MWRRLNIYLFRQTSIAFLFAIAALVVVVMFTQSFRLISLVMDNSGTLLIFIQLMGLMMLTFLPVLAPIGLGVAVVFTYYKLAIDSELIVMRSMGISPLDLIRPALVTAMIVTIIGYFLTLWITPWANRELVSLQYKVKDNFSIFMVKAGAFNDLADGLTFYVSDRGHDGELEDILIHDVRVQNKPITIMAEKGQFTVDADGKPQIIVSKGKRQEINRETGRLSQLDFDRYVVDIRAIHNNSLKRVPDPRELPTNKLIIKSFSSDSTSSENKNMSSGRESSERSIAELHQRITMPLLSLGFCIMGLTSILAGAFNRRGMTKRVVVAATSIVSLQAASLSLGSLIVKHIWLAPALYLVVIIPLPVCFYILRFNTRFRLPFFARKSE